MVTAAQQISDHSQGGGQAGRGAGRASSCFSLVRKIPASGCLSALGDFVCLLFSVVG